VQGANGVVLSGAVRCPPKKTLYPNRGAHLGAAVGEEVALGRVEFRGGDHFGQVLHVSRLDVDDVEAGVATLQVPQVDAQVVCTNVRLAVLHRGQDFMCGFIIRGVRIEGLGFRVEDLGLGLGVLNV